MLPRPFAFVVVREVALGTVGEVLVRVLAREEYVRWDPTRIPSGYPALRGEFERWILGERSGSVVLIPSSWNRVFHRVRDLSRETPGIPWVAALEPPGDPIRVKVFVDGDLRLKVGPDADEEIPYHPLPATPTQVREFLGTWMGARSVEPLVPGDPEALARILGVPGTRPPFADLWQDPGILGWGGLDRWTFIDRRSRLAREA